ncbi:3-hydroxyacyl-ACP dehydratase FabZ family protein [Streptomyces lycii]|uniref:3-hydroxyacyl-ACP dehydratase FabZ family protein n=1 Tax=Streptomyces lycii TaxID=2654337 RepID=UPI00159E94C6|nr:3-hydroxyacyl-ACP dehydratase [Streptomyces lycii]
MTGTETGTAAGPGTGTGTSTGADADRIASVIPHRPPALLVDRVTEVEPGRRLVAVTDVRLPAGRRGTGTGSGPAGAEYAYPLGLLLESWAQAAVLLACWEKPNPDVLAGQVALLAGVRDARALAPVRAGSVLEHEVRVLRDLGDTVITTGRSTVAGRPVLEMGQLTLALRGAGTLAPAPAGTTAGPTGAVTAEATGTVTENTEKRS